jgi:uncharacterized phiE125 gp8 family phage protein
MLAQLIIAGVYDPAVAPVVTGEPVSLAEIKRHLDIVRNDQDEMLLGMIVAAREWVENYTGLILTRREVVQVFDRFTGRMQLNAWPVAEDATVSAQYTDNAGQQASVEGLRLMAAVRPARINPAFGVAWPSAACGEPIVVRVLAGYAAPADVPYSLKAAISLMVGDLYNQREETAVGVSIQASGAVTNLCHPYRMPVIG